MKSILIAASAALAITLPAHAGLYDYDTTPPKLTLGAAHDAGGVQAQDFSFVAASGNTVTGEIISGAGAGPHPGVLFVHWLGEEKTTNHTEFEPDARALAAKGVTSVLIDTMWAKPDWFETVGPDAAADGKGIVGQVIEIRQSLDILLSRDGVDATHVAYVGHDFGAMFGALTASEDPRPSAWVLMAAVPEMSTWYRLGKKKGALPGREAYDKALAVYDIRAGVKAIAGKPVLMQFAKQDVYVSEEQAKDLAAGAPNAEVKWYDTDHALAVTEAASDRAAFLAKALGLK